MLISLKDLVTLTQTIIGQDLNASLEKWGTKRADLKNSIIMHTLKGTHKSVHVTIRAVDNPLSINKA